LMNEVPYTSPTGASGYFEYILAPVRGADGEVESVAGTSRDISGRKRAAEEREQLLESERSARTEAERASRMKDEFLATLSHELRTPLNAILGWATILRTEPTAAEVSEGVEVIERNARAQARIIEDLLDMSRIISGKVRLDVQRVDLASVLEAAMETVRPAANAKGVRLHAVLDPLALPVSGDPSRLQQVFWNLLTNAVKFTPRGGRIQVLLGRVNSHLEASVMDTGAGIAPEFLPHVFDRFRQADASTTRRHGGLGLGLAIVKQLVELHGGSVTAKSAGAGHGAAFAVSLPLSALHPASEEQPERRHPTSADSLPADVVTSFDLTGVNVLVVDDEPDARGLIARLLTGRRATVRTAGSAGEAFEMLQAEKPDILISDIGMPNEDGYSLIRRVRALDAARGGNIPAPALTAYARTEDRMKAVLAGFQMHVAKPVEAAELLTMVASLAGRRSE
ncbi:MAG: ATP-binding protein, partial [Chthoniobacterales bacterium]